jgi:hypothetical protein
MSMWWDCLWTVHPPDDMRIEPRWDDTATGKPKISKKNLSQCDAAHHKTHTNWLGSEPGPPQWEAGL